MHKHKLRLIVSTIMTGEKKELEGDGGRHEGRELKNQTSHVMYMEHLPKVAVKCMHCEHILIKMFKIIKKNACWEASQASLLLFTITVYVY